MLLPPYRLQTEASYEMQYQLQNPEGIMWCPDHTIIDIEPMELDCGVSTQGVVGMPSQEVIVISTS